MSTPTKGTALITGASAGIGAIYADRLAQRGHDLILVVRDKTRLAGLAQRLRSSTGRSVDTVAADLNDAIVRIRKTTICGADLQHQTSESRPTDSFCGEVSYRFTIKPTTVCFSAFCTDLFQLAALNID